MLEPMSRASKSGHTLIATMVAVVFAALGLEIAFETSARAQTPPARPMITQAIVESNLARLFGNVRPEAVAANDRGRVPDNFSMEHMLLQLKRPPAQEQALSQLIDQLHDSASPNFHRWLSPTQFGAQFGPAASDIQQVTGWLQRHGFTVNLVYPSGMTIDFSGNAGQIFAAFHTEIHSLQARGATHFANMSDPQIPAALASAVAGIVSLNDFMPRPVMRKPKADYTVGGGSYLVTPADLATIYNFTQLFNNGFSGQNQTIYLIEDTDLYSTNDWTTFRSAFGLSGYTGASLSTVHPAPPSGSNNCNAPGVNADDGEAILDAEYASAAAPSAAIVMASCRSTFSTFGGLIAMQNLINGPNPPAIISLSYGECEASNGAASNAAYNAIFQQGVAEGTSIFVASGDADAGVCDNGTAVTHGIGVSAFASTPYNVAVGGTDFSDTYSGTNATYWSSGNTAANGSALSYIPEIPWNDSCASQLLATFLNYATTHGASGFCNSTPGANFLNNVGGSGGPSGCATGSPSTSGVVSGTCAGYPKPSWQAGVVGIPNDGVRGLPDVSLFAANGLWGHYYVFCYSDPTSGYGGAPCTGAPSGWSAPAEPRLRRRSWPASRPW
jgi:subtilase family serine protease